MPFDLYADFRSGTAPVTDGVPWTSVAHSFAMKLALAQPRLRFRLRNRRSPDVLGAGEVPPELDKRREIPPRGMFWVRWYYCEACKTHVRHHMRTFHSRKGHELTPGRITHRGLREKWEPDVTVLLGPGPFRMADVGGGSKMAVTATHVPPDQFSGLDAVFLLRLKKVDHEAAATAFRAAMPRVGVYLLPAGLDAAAAAFVEQYQKRDVKALDEMEDEEAEHRDMVRRLSAAGRHLVGEVGTGAGSLAAPVAQVESKP